MTPNRNCRGVPAPGLSFNGGYVVSM
jgi:hypothetical protein